VHDTVCNFYDFYQKDDRTPASELRCLGVSYDGIADAAGAKLHPDKVGRYPVIVSGAVTLMCNKEDLQDCHVGDLLAWDYRDNACVYHGLPSNFSTVKIVKAGSGFSACDGEPGHGLFGPPKEFNPETDGAELSKQVGFQGGAPACPRDKAAHIAVFALACLGMSKQDAKGWADHLYNPNSPWWMGVPMPESEHDETWMMHITTWVNNTVVPLLGGSGSYGWTSKEARTVAAKCASGITPDSTKFSKPVIAALKNAFNGSLLKISSIVTIMTGGKNLTSDEQSYMESFIDESNLLNQMPPAQAMNVMYDKLGFTNGRVMYGRTPEEFDAKKKSIKVLANLGFSTLMTAQEAAKTQFMPFAPTTAADVTAFTNAIGSPMAPDATWYKDKVLQHIGMSMNDGQSRVFGVLLEKSVFSNEARVLLTPGYSA
jgi:hypothetical protein